MYTDLFFCCDPGDNFWMDVDAKSSTDYDVWMVLQLDAIILDIVGLHVEVD